MGRLYLASDHVVDDSKPTSKPAEPPKPSEPQRSKLYPRSGHVVEPKEDSSAGDTSAPSQRAAISAEPPAGDAIKVPERVAKLRAENKSPYDPTGLYGDAVGVEGRMNDPLPGVPQPVRAEIARMMSDAGVTPTEAGTLVRTMRLREPPTAAEQRDAERYLDTVSDADVAAAMKLLDRDPRAKAVLEQTGAINRIDVLRVIVDAARRQRDAGRL